MYYTYSCDNCKKQINGRKAYDVIKFIYKQHRQHFGYCSSKCHWEHKNKLFTKFVKCKNCNKSFKKDIGNIIGNSFCSQSCSAKYNNKHRNKDFYKKTKIIICKICKRKHSVPLTSRKQNICKKCIRKSKLKKCRYCHHSTINKKYCSLKCKRLFFKRKMKLEEYRRLCMFNFPLQKFKKEYDISFIKKYGWYHHLKNTNGVSRDHILSVSYGFEHKVNPEFMSHPANCQLLRHKENQSKREKCNLTIQQLMKKIKKWNKYYKQNQ